MLIAEFTDKEEQIFNQLVEWLSNTLCTTPAFLSKKCNSIDINYFTRTVTDEKGNEIHLTAKEFDLLHFLSSHKGQVFTKEQIYEKVWGYDNAPDASNLSSFIRKLRLKIEPHPDNPRYIITVWGVGYKFSGEEKP
ncbi:winged helix-turn-helix domain-containing protein [Faecalitalea cylindroides]|nr:winged helix-turn-helix domain-containing protein [Faecalitalea cylindroides]